MSLAREALRIATVRALRGATWVGDRVRDSEAGPFDDQAQDKPEPGIIVYTDDGKFGGGAQSKTLFAGGETSLVIEIVITQRMRVRVLGENGPEEQILWDMPETDAAMELTLGMIERQVKVALSDPGNIWSEMWRRFALAIGECSSQRGASMREGVRFAGRQIVLPVTLPADPTPGTAPGPLWTEFLALVDATPDLAPAADMLRAMIEGTPAHRPEWLTQRFAFGLTEGEAGALGLAPPEAARETSPAFQEPGT